MAREPHDLPIAVAERERQPAPEHVSRVAGFKTIRNAGAERLVDRVPERDKMLEELVTRGRCIPDPPPHHRLLRQSPLIDIRPRERAFVHLESVPEESKRGVSIRSLRSSANPGEDLSCAGSAGNLLG